MLEIHKKLHKKYICFLFVKLPRLSNSYPDIGTEHTVGILICILTILYNNTNNAKSSKNKKLVQYSGYWHINFLHLPFGLDLDFCARWLRIANK